MTSVSRPSDKADIDELVRRFFLAFDNRDGVHPDLESLRELFVAGALISKAVAAIPELYSVEDFIEPRRALLTDGTLVDFEERELAERTETCGNISQRICLYEKSGKLAGQPFRTRGVKTLQFVRTPKGWKIAAVAWDDERDGFEIDLSRFRAD
jgi:hypothetical protein